jgi:hypothetical protein
MSWIYDTCLALAHRWEPERVFLIYTAYFDESGTHNAELSVMAGFFGNAQQWRKFEKRVAKLFVRFGVDIFHTIDVRRTDKDFAGWSVDKKIDFLDEFQHIINETLENGVVAYITEEVYQYYLSLPWPKTPRRDSKYTLMFRACLASTIDKVALMPSPREPKLHIVLEDGHKNANDALRIYSWAQSRLFHARSLAGLTFASKGDCLPVAAADLLAYSAWGNETGQKIIGKSKKPLKSSQSVKPYWRIDIDREQIDRLHDQAIEMSGASPLRRQSS